MATIIKPIITRIDTSTNWKTLNPIPKNGEQCIEDLGKGLYKLKVGDGVTPWIALKYHDDAVVGNLADLLTDNKSSIVEAVNNVFYYALNVDGGELT